MSEVRLIDAPLEISFDKVQSDNESLFKREYDSFSESDDDPIGQWIRLARAKGDTRDSDQVLLTLVVELHRKIDELNARLSKKETKVLDLSSKEHIESIGYEHFKISADKFIPKERYYGRITMPVFPKRDVAIFFEAKSESLAHISMMHQRDVDDWGSYITARERAMIREMKGMK